MAPTQTPSETKSRCGYLALQEAVGERRSERSGVPGRARCGKQTVAGRRRWARAGNEHQSLESWYTSWLFPVPLSTLLVLTDQELVPCFLEFRFSEIAVNRTRVSNGSTRASTAGFHFSNSHLGKLSSHTVLPSLRRKGYTGDSLRPWEALGSAPYKHFTPPKHQKMRLEHASQEKWGKAEAAW